MMGTHAQMQAGTHAKIKAGTHEHANARANNHADRVIPYPTQINVAEGAAADLPDESVLSPNVELRLRRSARARHGATWPDL